MLNRTNKSKEIVLNVFKSLTDKYVSIYEKHALELEKIGERLKREYGEGNSKYKLIEKKIKDIQRISSEVREDFIKFIAKSEVGVDAIEYGSHKQLEDTLVKNMKETLKNLKNSSHLSVNEEVQLSSYQNKDSLKTKIIEFLHIGPKSARDFKEAAKKTTEELNVLDDYFKNLTR